MVAGTAGVQNPRTGMGGPTLLAYATSLYSD